MSSNNNRFQDFFDDHRYVALKNHLYNYFLRKRDINKFVAKNGGKPSLEVGSGLSPMISHIRSVVYSDLSWSALRELKTTQSGNRFVAADGTMLPFKDGSFAQVVCSEVMEHIGDDRSVMREIARVLAPSGSLIVTFPHRRFYYGADDRFVRHLRRYELAEMVSNLQAAGLDPLVIRKVLGPLEKLTMLLVVYVYAALQCLAKSDGKANSSKFLPAAVISMFKWISRIYGVFVWLDARIMPRSLAAVILIKAIKRP
jgi:ubiquinone/menaquinone biosynthesis C-methylase UbiE